MKRKQPKKLSSATLRLRTILVPVDFSSHASKALRYAIPLATTFGARITLVHILSRVIYPTEMGIVVTDGATAETASRKRLAALAQKLVPEKLLGKILVREGEPFDEIAQVARKTKADLIICTTHGYTGLTHVLLGSTAERIVRHAPCPVLTVRVR